MMHEMRTHIGDIEATGPVICAARKLGEVRIERRTIYADLRRAPARHHHS